MITKNQIVSSEIKVTSPSWFGGDFFAVTVIDSEGSVFQQKANKIYDLEDFLNKEKTIQSSLFSPINNIKIYQTFQEKLQQAIQDEELTFVNAASDDYFQAFLNQPRALKAPAFFVNSFNNIELTWRVRKVGTVDLQFLEDGLIQYVLFSEDKEPDCGRASPDSMIEKIKAFGLWDLVYEPA